MQVCRNCRRWVSITSASFQQLIGCHRRLVVVKMIQQNQHPSVTPPFALATGGDTRMQMLVRLVNSRTHVGINVKADVPNEIYTVDSIANVFAGANWHEREAHEMFGIGFVGHPDLRNMYLPTDFEGFPMRKDFPLLARMVKPWPGIVDVEPLPGGDAESEEAS